MHLYHCLAVLLGAGLALLPTAYGSGTHQAFLDAEAAINNKDVSGWLKLKPALKDHPLYADLIYKIALREITRTSNNEARNVLKALANTPLQASWRRSWLKLLAQRKRWNDYLDFYEAGLGTILECHYANALYTNGQADKAWPVVRKLWLHGRSQPEACDPAFAALKKTDKFDDQLVMERAELAIRKGRTSLAKYLIRYLPSDKAEIISRWLSVRARPQRTQQKYFLHAKDPDIQKILIYGIKRMALFDAGKADRHWQKIKSSVQLDHDQQQEIERYLALRMTTQKLPGAVEQHKKITQPDREINEWAARSALQAQDWKALDEFVSRMGDIGNLDDRWKYWKARASQQNGDDLKAKTIYQLLASDRGYHNFLAADRIAMPYQFKNKPLQFSADELEPVQSDYNVQRARAYFELDRLPEARREWYYLRKHHGDENRRKLAYLAKQWGWHSQAILTIATSDYNDDLSMRFPVLYRDQVLRTAKNRKLDPSWIMALIRQESAFQPDARSPAGARGLMQLMPATGRQVAKMMRYRKPRLHDFYQPDLNISLGTYYLRRNLVRFKNHLVLATAAYNAGPHRVEKWLADPKLMDADAWVEAIPFSETRGYVQRILSYASIYDDLLGKPVRRLEDRMPAITM